MQCACVSLLHVAREALRARTRAHGHTEWHAAAPCGPLATAVLESHVAGTQQFEAKHKQCLFAFFFLLSIILFLPSHPVLCLCVSRTHHPLWCCDDTLGAGSCRVTWLAVPATPLPPTGGCCVTAAVGIGHPCCTPRDAAPMQMRKTQMKTIPCMCVCVCVTRRESECRTSCVQRFQR